MGRFSGLKEQPLQGLASQECEETTVSAGNVVGQEPTDAWTTRSRLTVVLASVVWESTTYTVRLLLDHLRSRRLIEFIPQFSTALLFFDGATALCQRDLNHSRLLRPLRICRAWCRLSSLANHCPPVRCHVSPSPGHFS